MLSLLSSAEPTPSTLGAVALASLLAWLLLVPSRAQRAVAQLPRPQGSLPILGATLLFMNKHRGRLHQWLYEEALRLHGRPFVVDIPTRPPIVVISEAATMAEVLKTQGHKFGKGDNFTQSVADVFGEGAFVAEGPKGLRQRRTTSHFFAPQLAGEIMREVVPTLTRRLCAIVGDAARSNQEIDMKHLLELFATDVSTSIGFGVDLRFMEKENREFLERFDRARFVTLFRQQQPVFLWKLMRLLRLGVEGQQIEDVAWLDQFVYDIIQQSMARHEKGRGSSSATAKDILSLFLQRNGDEIDVKELRDMAMVLLSAGRKTTAYALSWCLAMMVQYPEMQRRIRDELRTQLPELVAGEIDVPTKEQAARLVYLEAVVKETVRLNTVVPINTRDAIDDVVLSDGTSCPRARRCCCRATACHGCRPRGDPTPPSSSPSAGWIPRPGRSAPRLKSSSSHSAPAAACAPPSTSPFCRRLCWRRSSVSLRSQRIPTHASGVTTPRSHWRSPARSGSARGSFAQWTGKAPKRWSSPAINTVTQAA